MVESSNAIKRLAQRENSRLLVLHDWQQPAPQSPAIPIPYVYLGHPAEPSLAEAPRTPAYQRVDELNDHADRDTLGARANAAPRPDQARPRL